MRTKVECMEEHELILRYKLSNWSNMTVKRGKGGEKAGLSRYTATVNVCRYYFLELHRRIIRTIAPCSRCYLELETKVHPKVRNQGEGPY